MTGFRKALLVVLWVVSLVGVAHWTARAQSSAAPGVEVRFLPGPGKPGTPQGTLVANLNGQWLRVTLDTLPVPGANTLVPR
jgi:hypothetical protein